MVALLALAVSCGKSGDNSSGGNGNPGTKSKAERPSEKGGDRNSPGQKPGSKPQNIEDIDVDKLDIPDQLKEAIKSGRIPKDQIPAMLARFQSGGGDAVPVSVEPVQLKNLNSYLVLNGIVEPERMVEIFSRLSAYVQKIVKEEGAYVKENDILVLLDDTEIKISYEQSRIELEQAKLSLDEAEQNYIRNQELSSAWMRPSKTTSAIRS